MTGSKTLREFELEYEVLRLKNRILQLVNQSQYYIEHPFKLDQPPEITMSAVREYHQHMSAEACYTPTRGWEVHVLGEPCDGKPGEKLGYYYYFADYQVKTAELPYVMEELHRQFLHHFLQKLIKDRGEVR